MKEMNCQVKVENKYQDNIDADKGWIDVFKYLDTLHVPHKNMKAQTEFPLAGIRTTA